MKTYTVYDESDCTDEELSEANFQDRYLILKPDYLNDKYRDAKYQLVLATGGFGCDPKSSGRAIFVKEVLPDDEAESYRVNRPENPFIGFASEQTIARHKRKYIDKNED